MVSEELTQINVARGEVLEQIGRLKHSKSQALDGVYLTVLKDRQYEIAHILTKICNLSLKSTSTPEDWKKVPVKPIFRKGS